MKGFLFLNLVGVALYGALVVSNDVISRTEDPLVRQNLGDPDSRQLRSWGSDLTALVNSNSQRTSVPLRKPDVLKGSSDSESDSGAGGLPIYQRQNQRPRNQVARHTSRLNGRRSLLPRRRTAKPPFPLQSFVSISSAQY
jgi:hypothetical protein